MLLALQIFALPFAKRFVVRAPAPAKLATDIIAAIVSLYFFWQDDIVIGLATHFIPAPIARAAVIHLANLEPSSLRRGSPTNPMDQP